MIAIIGAMSEEVLEIKSKIKNMTEKTYVNIKFYEGMIEDKFVVLMQSGIGKVNASLSTTVLLEHYNIEKVINIGTAGGLKPDCEVLDIVISENVFYHDVDVTAFSYKLGQVPQMPLYFKSDENLVVLAEKILKTEKLAYHKGLIASGDQFISNEEQRKRILTQFSEVIAVEMEASAIAQVCYIYKKPFIILRSLSDIAGKESELTFSKFLEQSATNSANIVLKLINNL